MKRDNKSNWLVNILEENKKEQKWNKKNNIN